MTEMESDPTFFELYSFHNIREAEDFVYDSYLKAAAHQDYATKDAGKRHPELTRALLRSKSDTPCVVITGSKGKGSVANMISQILQIRFRTGLMTSPHITDFRERFRVNGEMIPAEDFCRIMSRIQPEIRNLLTDLPNTVCISPMGIQADLALTYFREQKTDFNVFECGKGARYDDVNNILHDYAVINRIFLEHTRELGDTLTAIAEDKSYVITGEQKCVYLAEQEPEVLEVLLRRAAELKVPCKIYGRDFRAENIQFTRSGMRFDVVIGEHRYPKLELPLLGEHQAKNCALALALCEDVLLESCRGSDSADLFSETMCDRIREQLAAIRHPGRMEILSTEPFLLLDACINAASCENVKDVLRHLGILKATVIVGIPDDKDYAGVVRSMREVAERILLTRSQNPHYRFTREQERSLAEEGLPVEWTESIEEALQLALTGSSLSDFPTHGFLDHSLVSSHPVVILGTTSVISEVEQIFIADYPPQCYNEGTAK